MSSTFDEFQFMINQTNFVAITLWETWLKNDKHLLEYVRLPGSKFACQNWDEKCSCGVGIYIRNVIEVKVRNDILKLNESIEHLWVEIQERKKTLPTKFWKKQETWMDRKTRIRAVNSEIDVEWNIGDNWRQQHWFTCINWNLKKIYRSTWNLWFKQPYHQSNLN